ncbi:hypothetical protein BDZ89DRAFT_1064322 [Hymenopellis radicata]|nr:hypothetical protein BDZ89DRAFT_1064322 [Hymenopellis radicata]
MARKAQDLDIRIMAAPVSRDGFSFDGRELSVVVENNRHTRCDSVSLHALLTHQDPPPVMTKAGKPAKRQPPPFVDRPGHFYCAQLLHYGLKPLKTKDSAKKRLLESYNSDRQLHVPTAIVQLEQKLRADFKKINDAALEADKGAVTQIAMGPSPSKKAKGEDAPRTKQTARKSSQPAIHMPAAVVDNVPKAESSAPRTVPATVAAPEAKARAKPRTMQTARKTTGKSEVEPPMPAVARVPKTEPTTQSIVPTGPVAAESETKPRTKLTARKTTGGREPAVAQARPKQTAVKTSSAAARLRLAKELLSLPPDQGAKLLQSLFQEYSDAEEFVKEKLQDVPTKASGSTTKGIDYEGQYAVEAPSISKQWDYGDNKYVLKLALSSKTSHLWGTFEFGVISGVIRSKGSVTSGSRSINFQWRGREEGENVISLGSDNSGRIEFLVNGNIKGTINTDLGKFAFTGKKMVRENVVWSMSIANWKYEWRSTNESAYECENKGRWGGWGGDPRPDGPEDSDSSVAGYADSDVGYDSEMDFGY